MPETGFYHIVKATSESPESIASDRGYPTIDAAFIEFSYQAGIVTPLESCVIIGIEEHAGDWDIAKCDCIRGNLPAVSAPGLLKEEIEKAKPQPTSPRPSCFGSFS